MASLLGFSMCSDADWQKHPQFHKHFSSSRIGKYRICRSVAYWDGFSWKRLVLMPLWIAPVVVLVVLEIIGEQATLSLNWLKNRLPE